MTIRFVLAANRSFYLFLLLIYAGFSCLSCKEENLKNTIEFNEQIPAVFRDYISEISYDSLGDYKAIVHCEVISDNLIRINLTYIITDTLTQDDWQINVIPNFQPTFHWAPHLTPTDDHIIAQYVFRSPAMIISDDQKQLVLIPDLDIMQKGTPIPWYMDMDAKTNKLTLGLSKYKTQEHMLFIRDSGATYLPGNIEIGFYLIANNDKENISNPWENLISFFWEKWGSPLYEKGFPITGSLEPYVEHTYKWALDNWKDAVWQEFKLNNTLVGAPVFIVNFTQSPNYPGEADEREYRSIWNQAWFSSLRSAQGMYRYARRTNNNRLLNKANMTKEMALAFPKKNGFFYGMITTEMENVEVEGKKYRRSKGWDTYIWGNSNRNPLTRDPVKSPFHILDMSWTSFLMLKWYEELEQDERLLQYAINYASALLEIQDENGFFPAWLTLDSLKPIDILLQSPETSMSVTFLLKLHELTSSQKYLNAAIKAMDAVIENIIPQGRWEDFETYWSCSKFGIDQLNQKFERNNMHKQNNFSMYWTAEALYYTYKITNNDKYLRWGKRTLDELLMTQAIWQPPYMFVNTLGGFGVMNADGEWNDARQSLFAELIILYGVELNNQIYIQRGLAALKASFVMMYCPENKDTKFLYERKFNFFDEKDFGFMMENYGHGGVTSPDGLGIGGFTIYDWGNGSASEAYNRIIDHYGEPFIYNN